MTESDIVVEDSQAAHILKSGIFDVGFYQKQTGMQLSALECVRHYLREGARLGHRPNRLFDPAAYLALHEDVARAGLEPFLHYVTSGMREGREVAATPEFISSLADTPASALEMRRIRSQASSCGWTPQQRPSPRHAVAVYASSLGCSYNQWAADQLANGLQQAGCRVYRLDQNSRQPQQATVDFIVAPHEFFRLGAGSAWSDRVGQHPNIALNMIPLFDRSYFAALDAARNCRIALDVSPHSAQQLPDLGFLRSGFLPLVCARPGEASQNEMSATRAQLAAISKTVWIEDDDQSSLKVVAWAKRPIDVLFVGTLTRRRSKALAQLAPALARYRCCLLAPSKIQNSGRGRIGFAACRYLARRSKIILNLHADDLPRFEWHRIVNMGIEGGAVVVSEPVPAVPGIQEGDQYLTADIGFMSELIDHILQETKGRKFAAALIRQAKDHLYRVFDMATELSALVTLVESGGAGND